MLLKLLKYDFKSVARVWWIIALGVLGVSTAGAVALRVSLSVIGNEKMVLLVMMGFLCLIGAILTIAASTLVTELLIYWRFYKHLYTDEGYLTFTLPASRKTILFSKSLNAMIWLGLQAVLTTICIGIFVLISPPSFEDLWMILRLFGTEFGYLWQGIGAWMFVYAATLLLLTFVSTLMGIFLVQFCITVGAVVAKKAKLLAAIGIYYGVTMVSSMVGQVASWFFTMTLAGGLFNLMGSQYPFLQHSGLVLFLLLAVVVVTTIACTLYCATLNLLERKLNLP